MTVIVALMNRHCTVHASDSFITELQEDGTRKVRQSQRTKIVPVRHFRGAMSYWGVGDYETHGWSTFEWLKKQAQGATEFPDPEEFARQMAKTLDERISQMDFQDDLDAGIGIHFTAYERVSHYWIPELFLVTNYASSSYDSLRDDGVHVSRRTYHKIKPAPPLPEHREREFRIATKDYFLKRTVVFNNGDPSMFMPVAEAIAKLIGEIEKRGNLVDASEVGTYQRLARRPIEVVCAAQRDFARKGRRTVGGMVHDIAITPTGGYYSRSGDV